MGKTHSSRESSADSNADSSRTHLPKYGPRWVALFRRYLSGYLRKNFHTLSVAGDFKLDLEPGEPLVVYLNHASWWDPLVVLKVSEWLVPDRAAYAPFDKAALERYPFFQNFGFFGVEQETRRGAADFLRSAGAIMASPTGSLWMTPEGRFTDPRDHDAEFKPGLAHLAERMSRQRDNNAPAPRGRLLPLAIEYPFWEERRPEALVRLGESIPLADYPNYSKEAWQALLEQRLHETQQQLAELSIARTDDAFTVMLGGDAGVGGGYELFRRFKAAITGSEYRANHSDKLTTASDARLTATTDTTSATDSP